MSENSENYTPVEVSLKSLLEVGAHFGHSVECWNPKMLPFIYGKRNNVHVINLDLTLTYWERCADAIRKFASEGKKFLFVGTKDQAQSIVKEAAERCGSFYVNYRWLGGALTNFETMKRSIRKMEKMEELLHKAADPESEIKLAKKEQLKIKKDLEKLSVNLDGIRKMRGIPDLMFVVDIKKDSIAVEEARKLAIPVIALVDTNVDPELITFPVPSNDDSKKAIHLFVNAVADQILAGRNLHSSKSEREEPVASSDEIVEGKVENEEENAENISQPVV